MDITSYKILVKINFLFEKTEIKQKEALSGHFKKLCIIPGLNQVMMFLSQIDKYNGCS